MSSTEDDPPSALGPSGPSKQPIESGTTESGTTGSGTTGSGTIVSGTIVSGTIESATIESATAESATVVSETNDDGAMLPAELDGEHALRDAIGPSQRNRRREITEDPDDDEPAPKQRSRRTIAIASLSIIVGVSTATLIFLGRANAQRYAILCTATRVTAEQGRSFPPWGTHPLNGAEWKPITLPSNAECKPRETDDVNELGKWYGELLVDRATTLLTARNLLDSMQVPVGAQPAANPLDTAAEALDQALLLARNPDRRDQRKDIERLLGDVEYWRASLRLRDASVVLLDAAKQFETAAAQRPRHVSDAAAWAAFLRKLTDELHAGPGGVPSTQFPPPPAGSANEAPVAAPAGVALPVEPAGSAAEPAPPPAPDAGLPSGGVLL